QFATAGPLPSPSTFSGNTYLTTRPASAMVAVRPNGYETGRGNIIVYNRGLQPAVTVDLSSVLAPGASYEIRNAQNFFASTVRSGVYTGPPVSIPMSGSAAPSVSFGAPTPSGPEFNAFVVLTKAAAPPPTATPPPSGPTPPPPTTTPVPPPNTPVPSPSK